MSRSEYDSALEEVYGTPADLERAFRGVRFRPKQKPDPEPWEPIPKRRRVPGFRLVGDRRVQCPCGVWVYSVSLRGEEAAIPAVCWRCEEPL